VEPGGGDGRRGDPAHPQDQDPRPQALRAALPVQPRLHVSRPRPRRHGNARPAPEQSRAVVCCSLLATCSADQTCKIWRTSNFSLMTELSIRSNNPGETSRGWMWDCAFSGDSQYIVTGRPRITCWSCDITCNIAAIYACSVKTSTQT